MAMRGNLPPGLTFEKALANYKKAVNKGLLKTFSKMGISTRMTSMPVVLPDTFEVDSDTAFIARAWRPEYAKAPRPLDVVVSTNENYADLLVRQYPNALSATKSNGTVEVGVTFESPRAALRLLLDCADRVRLQSPKSLKNELAAWLKDVNRGKTPDVTTP